MMTLEKCGSLIRFFPRPSTYIRRQYDDFLLVFFFERLERSGEALEYSPKALYLRVAWHDSEP